jgi:membrane protein DedA with SNARE-associated domain
MTSHVTNWIADHGLVAVFVLMAIDAVLPAGGELVMLFGGALAAGAVAGHSGPSLGAVIAAGTLGYLAGSLGGWAIGRAGGRRLIDRYGRWLHIGPQRFLRAERWFARYGASFVLVGRLLPLVRSFVSIPAGVLEFPLARYALLSGVASLVWCVAFAAGGHALGNNWESLHHTFRYLDYAAVAAVLVAAAMVALRFRKAR